MRRASPGGLAVAADERDAVAGLELDGVVAQRADAQLRARAGPAGSRPGARRGPRRRARAAPSRRAARRVPWLKFSRATSMPASTMRTSTSGSREAGPIVATIFVRRSMAGTVRHGHARSRARSTRGVPTVDARTVRRVSRRSPGEHGEHAAVVVLGGRQPELDEDVRDVLLDRALGDDQRLGDRGVRAALGHQPEHLALARGELVERAVVARAEQLGDGLGVERRAALGDAADGVDELAHVGDAVLEQVADAAAPVGEQLGGVGPLDVLREHEHRQARDPPARLERGAHALVAERRRQADVDDADVRPVLVDGGQEGLAVVDRGHDLEAALGEQAAEPSRRSARSSAITTRTGAPRAGRVGPPGGLRSRSVPSSAARRLRRPSRPCAVGVGAAVAVVAHLDAQAPVSRHDAHLARRAGRA